MPVECALQAAGGAAPGDGPIRQVPMQMNGHGHLRKALLGGCGGRPRGLRQQVGQCGAGGGAEDALACSPLCLQPVDLSQRSTA
jgi:hypothetical protein